MISVLTDSKDPSDYWITLKRRLTKDEGSELPTICRSLKFEAKDGKMRNTDTLDTKGIFRLIESMVDAIYKNETLWLTQKAMAKIFDCSIDNISLHLRNIFKDNELDEKSVVENSSVTVSDGKKYKTKIYNLDAIIAVGYRINSKKATEFRIWGGF